MSHRRRPIVTRWIQDLEPVLETCRYKVRPDRTEAGLHVAECINDTCPNATRLASGARGPWRARRREDRQARSRYANLSFPDSEDPVDLSNSAR